MSNTPITITLYDSNNEGTQYSRSIIPWGVLKKAIALTKDLDEQEITEEDVNAIAGLVVDAFGNQFTLDDLDKGADVGDMMAVLNNIVARASALVTANPTRKPNASKRSK